MVNLSCKDDPQDSWTHSWWTRLVGEGGKRGIGRVSGLIQSYPRISAPGTTRFYSAVEHCACATTQCPAYRSSVRLLSTMTSQATVGSTARVLLVSNALMSSHLKGSQARESLDACSVPLRLARLQLRVARSHLEAGHVQDSGFCNAQHLKSRVTCTSAVSVAPGSKTSYLKSMLHKHWGPLGVFHCAVVAGVHLSRYMYLYIYINKITFNVQYTVK